MYALKWQVWFLHNAKYPLVALIIIPKIDFCRTDSDHQSHCIKKWAWFIQWFLFWSQVDMPSNRYKLSPLLMKYNILHLKEGKCNHSNVRIIVKIKYQLHVVRKILIKYLE